MRTGAKVLFGVGMMAALSGCGSDEGGEMSRGPATRFTGATGEVRLVTLEPGHFHAALVQKYDHPQIDPVVHIFAPAGRELDSHLALVQQFNSRAEDPAHWQIELYTGDDYVDRMFSEKNGNVMVVAGHNGRKIEYIRRAVSEGMHVLADKPMVIVPETFPVLRSTLEEADRRGLIVNDVMTERHAITSILQRELSMIPELFGELEAGTPEDPAITKESVHFFSKVVSGAPLVRPPWFFDVNAQGEGIVDVSTHLVDLILWQSFPGEAIDYANPNDGVEVLSAEISYVQMNEDMFRRVTNGMSFPDYLRPVIEDGTLHVASNGEFTFRVRGVTAKVSVLWGYENPQGGDTHYSIMRGSRANLIIMTDAPQNFVASLYAQPAEGVGEEEFDAALAEAFQRLSNRYPGLTTRPSEFGVEIVIPAQFREGHEDHFTRVTEQYLASLVAGALPEWERTNLLTKYFITTEAYRRSR